MSVRMMTLIWDTPNLSPVDKLALLALADWANDDGVAWPSISQIATKTGCGQRTVQRAFRKAEEMGLLTRDEVKGKGCNYRLHPRHTGTPVTEAPPPHRRATPATVAPNTLEHTIIDKAKALPIARAKSAKPKWTLPDWIPSDAWEGFEEMRRGKGKTMTDRARGLIVTELEKLRGPPGEILNQSTRNSWLDVYELKDKQNAKGSTKGNDGMGVSERAARQAIHELSGGTGSFADCGGSSPASDYGRGGGIIDALPSPMRSIGYATG